ncbi:MAG TPA: hypothetical protein VNJ03_14285 [Vicinamibacterales bacterium]|nr:hypothetical protein [Vicinamibacterales bacterium]
MNSLIGKATGVVALGALAFTYGCGGTQATTGVRAQDVVAGQPVSPVVVSCEPHQRALVRPTVVNGAAVSQVECVAADPQAAAFAQAASVPVNAQPVYAQPAYTQAFAPAPRVSRSVPVRYTSARPRYVYDDLGDARIVRTRARNPVQRTRVVYDEPVRRSRSVKKSAIIIGSTAGVGAGVGAAVGGKKGALIGAAIGGGGAAIWDQVTRRK